MTTLEAKPKPNYGVRTYMSSSSYNVVVPAPETLLSTMPSVKTMGLSSFGGDSEPEAPATLAAEFTSPTASKITWSAVENATQYRIERALGSGNFTIINTITADTNTYSDSGLTTNANYRYRVSAINSAGVSDPSPVASVTPQIATNLAAPTEFGATKTAPNKIKLTWSGTTVSVAVLIQRSTDGGITWTDHATIPGNMHEYQDTVSRSTLYSYRLQSKTFSAVSVYTGSVSLLTPPAEVTSLLRTAVTTTSSTLQWVPVPGATGYVIEQSAEGGDWTEVATAGAGESTVTVTGLDAGTVYTYRISATNAGGSSGTTTVNGVLTISDTPQAPSLSAVDGALAVKITFDAVKGAASYVVERKSDGFDWGLLTELDGDETEYTDVQVLAGETYSYRIKAVNESGPSEYSNAASIPITAAGAIPTPTELSFTTTATTATLTWNANGGADSYIVERLLNGKWKTAATVVAPQADIKGLKGGTSTRVRVSAVLAGVKGNASDEITVTLPPGAVSGVKRLARTDGLIGFIWKAPVGATYYVVERSDDGGQTYDTLIDDSAIAAFVDETAIGGKTYLYRISAGNAAGAGPAAKPVSVVTPPVTPTGVSATLGTKSVLVSWTDVEGETGYKIQGSADGIKWSNAGAAKANATSATVKSTKFNLFRVIAFNKSGMSGTSSPAAAEASETTTKITQIHKSKSPFASDLLFSPNRDGDEQSGLL